MSANHKFPIPENDGASNHLEKSSIPSISLPNQEGNFCVSIAQIPLE